MNPPRWIDRALFDALSAHAADTLRRRRHHNFHRDETAPAHRLLNALEPDSYVRPHRHCAPDKDETLLCVRGALGCLIFDDSGALLSHCVLRPEGDAVGVDLPHGCFHSVVALEPGTVLFECKAGPYRPLTEPELAAWAPAEGSPQARGYLDWMHSVLRAGTGTRKRGR